MPSPSVSEPSPAASEEQSGQLPRLVRTPQDLRAALAGAGGVGLVPTMGALHQGHAELIRRARADHPGGVVVVSVFVNPLQFGPAEDFARYPRDLEADLRLAGAAGADLVFHPQPEDMYPPGFVSGVTVGGLAERLEGAARPGHFGGVATVVLKLLNMAGARDAYFGEKDWQQLQVVRRMVADLNHPARVVGVPTVRAASGLALSSRNRYLSGGQREQAAALRRALRAVQVAWGTGERRPRALLRAGEAVLAGEPAVQLESLALVDGELHLLGSVPTIEQTAPPAPGHDETMPTLLTDAAGHAARLLLAARLGGTRLIDNLPLVPDDLGGSQP